MLRFPPPARLPREAVALLKRQGIVADLAKLDAPLAADHPDVEHESVTRAIKRMPLAAADVAMPPDQGTAAVAPRIAGEAPKRARLASRKAMLAWLVLGLVAIVLAATIPR
jgi:hypothetical protein